ncbi:hypothetical protein J3R30DRAFT_3409911 [Lentinula aciculospora]|uniref:NAD(P)-binding protein n=1 Tax=Lentinula aciculospora TaxID=153920 RepID=A0A9W8ZXK2_9AGAR|nr:hypothetical protein J3R30DRAFT_3409911 [Lentinula aciculospora]
MGSDWSLQKRCTTESTKYSRPLVRRTLTFAKSWGLVSHRKSTSSRTSISQEDAGKQIVSYLKGDLGLGAREGGETKKLDLVIMNAGVFKADTLENPNWEDLLEMHKVVSIAPLMVASYLTKEEGGKNEFYESGGAVEPSEGAETTVDFILNELPHDLTGSFWAPRGPRDIGQGKDLPTPLPLPW